MNKAKKSALHQTYNQFMETGFKSGGLSSLQKIVVKEVAGFGSAKDEKIKGLAGLKALLHNQKKQTKGMTLTWKTKPFSKYITEDENTAVFAEDVYLTIKARKDLIKMYLRFSIVLNYINDQWKVIHWHGSKPEQVQSDEDTYGIDSLKQKNAELEKIVEEKTADLTKKNRELEIEAALEKVRAVAMSMARPGDLLRICQSLFNELRRLGFTDIRNTIINTFENKKPFFLDYDYSDLLGGTVTKIPINANTIIKNHLKRIKKGAEAFSETIVTQSEIKNWIADRRKRGEPEDPRLKKLKLLCYYFYSIGPAAIGISTYQKIGKEKLVMLKRFRNVFNLSYLRYVDIAKAEAQAREAQIEAALERVRSRAMAMHTSDELKEVAKEMRNQLHLLGQKELETCAIHLWDVPTGQFEAWAALRSPDNTGKIIESESKFKIKGIKILEENFQHYCDGKKDYVLINDVAKARQFFEALKHVDPKAYAFLSPTIKNKKPGDISAYWAVADFDGGSLVMVTMNPPEDNSRALLRRFADVFGLAYRRFSDLKKAEAQTRESQIQLALERVRARTMAMQDSKELSDTSFLLANQVRELGINAWGCAFHIYADNEEGDYEWFSNEDGYLPFYKTPRKKYFKQYFENRYCNEGIFIKEFKGKACATHYDFLMQIPVVGDALRGLIKSGIALPSSQIDHIVYFEYGYLLFITYQPVPEAHPIFKRFTKEFEQTYIRFLDLQKSEAQTRESQIQLALERVRARTMAMQKSYELGEAATLLFQQVKSLGIETYSSGFTVWENNDSELISWMCNADGSINPPFRMPAKEIEWHRQQYESWKKKEDFIIHDFTGREMKDHYKYLRSFPLLDEAFKKSEAASVATPERQVHNAFNFSKGNLLFITLHPVPEFYEIFKRFAKVFEQTYTRFLDLQKAESQTREAQIQLALERVRAKTMAMQKQKDLFDLVNVFGEQLIMLGLKVDYVSIIYGKISKSRDWNLWGCVPGLEYSSQNNLIPYKKTAYFTRTAENIEAFERTGNPIQVKTFTKKEKDDFLDHYFSFAEPLPDDFKKHLYDAPGSGIVDAFLNEVTVSICRYDFGSYTEEELDIFKRFSNEFRQSYIRFLDLQKAEAQAREAQIEAALEKVRSRSMGMQKSDELREVIRIVYEQFTHLNIHVEHAGFLIDYKTRDDLHIWLADEHLAPSEVIFPWFDCPPNNAIRNAKEKGDDFFFYHLNFKEKNKFYRDLFKLIPGIPEETVDYYLHCPGLAGSGVLLESIGLYIENFSGTVYTVEENAVLMRFGKVFQQTYTRFLDLQKAEAQAREAQIEAALERVRARTMAMQQSSELNPTADLLFEQLRLLGAELQGVAFAICDKDSDIVQKWTSIGVFSFSSSIEPAEQNMYEAWKNKVPLFEEVFEGERIRKYYETLMEVPAFKKGLQQLLDAGIPIPTWQKNHAVSFQQGYLLIITTKPFAETQIFIRFGKVFEQTYTRFLDLQKAEAQAREAQIEAALERVRSRSMAMHKSEELLEVINVVSNQLQQLEIRFGFVCFGIIHPQGNLDFWMAAPGIGQPENIHMPFVNNPITNSLIEAHKKGTRILKDFFPKEVMLEWSKIFFENNPDSQIMAQSKEYIQESPGLVRTSVILKEIDVFAGKFADKPFTDEQNEIIVRFANVFEQSYIRFLDLQKAEMQAREAKIEVSLEKVRTVALILKKSDEMLDVVQALYEALYDLGFTNIRNSIIDVHNPQKETFLDYDYSPQLGRSITEMSYYDSPFIENQVRKTEADNDAFFELILEGKELQELIDMRLKNGETEDPRLRQTKQLTYNLYSFGNGAIGISNFGLLSDEQKEILKRFRNVFAFAYKRYSDMVQAEALAREAQIEAALEKVRSRTLAMQKSDELADTAAVLFQQLITLGIAPNRLFIIIMKAGSSDLEAWVTDEDGSKVSIAFTADYQKNLSIKKMYEGWQQQKKSLVIDMQGEELQQYFHYLHDELKVPFKGGLEQKRRIQHLAYFSHGLIGMASPEEQPAETIQLLERFAAVFNLTFTRFNDLKIAEAHAIQAEQDLIAIKEAKQKAEEALTELQSTQKQLIQSEKMASLGELTAGIAHEIQNPLNFVNNFSEVSKELLDEMKEAIEKGDTEDAKQIMNDVIQNLEKINHHGKRADGIVKGMLQHSRSSTGQKELTDINVLCDEYLRLSYHGLRAKDKTFNAKFETSFDESIGKVNIVPQEIGRVILNLINNAFYAVSEKKKTADENYEPTVIVSTKKENETVLISVKDNGNGIPENIKDKIFQPFFTTKPTGQGTGLGLSLSYDIVKAHGGELKVETKEGEGSAFILLLPG